MNTNQKSETPSAVQEARSQGVSASDLDDDALERELRHLHETRAETFFDGSADALSAHTDRMLELEREYAQRFPERTKPAAARTREGARARDAAAARAEVSDTVS